ncbi:MAG: TonB family protein [Candidatus Solibacter sp.]
MATRTILQPRFYTWTFPGAPIRVRLLLDVVRELQAAFAGTARGGRPERTGILLGSAGHTTEICQTAPCPDLSPDTVARALERCRPSHGKTPVGFYRTQSEERLHLTEEEIAVARQYFSHPGDVFLIVHLAATGPETATFFFWDDTRIHADFAFLQFPFDVPLLEERERLRATEGEARHAGAVNEDGDPPAARIVPLPVPPSPPRGDGRRPRKLLLMGAGAILLMSAAFFAGRARLAPPKPAPTAEALSTLGLKLQRQASDLMVSWDRDAVVASGAESGLLNIRDGDQQKTIGLSREQLRAATILISPESTQVQIQLTLLLPDQKTLRASGMALIAARQQPPDTPPVTRAERPAPQRAVESRPRIASAARRAAPAPPHTLPPPPEVEPKVATPLAPPQTLAPPPVIPRPAPPVEAPLPAVAPPAGAPPAVAPPAGAAPTGTGTPRPGDPAEGHEVVPARFVSGRKPRYPDPAFRAHVEGTVVVEAVIGPNGEVKQMTVISGPGLLRDEAVNSVRAGKFTPARVNGKPVTAPTRVEVNFHGNW